jgi:hypothetical protein
MCEIVLIDWLTIKRPLLIDLFLTFTKKTGHSRLVTGTGDIIMQGIKRIIPAFLFNTKEYSNNYHIVNI